MTTIINIAIDGPAGSGKTSLGEALAQKIGYKFIDSGLFYRYFAKLFSENKISHLEKEQVISFCLKQKDKLVSDPKSFLEGLKNHKETLSTPEISNLASLYSPFGELRNLNYQLIRSLVKDKGFVVSGRDITFEVLPKAEMKVFLTASAEARAKRRYLQSKSEGKERTFLEVKKDLESRDKRDQKNISSAEIIGFKIDTTNLSFKESFESLYKLYLEKISVLNK